MSLLCVKDLANALSATAVGNTNLKIKRAAEPQDAENDDLAIATSSSFLSEISGSAARVALLSEGTDWTALDLDAAILVARPRFAMSALSKVLDQRWRNGPDSIHPLAVIHPTAAIAPGARIGAFCVIGEGVSLGVNAWLGVHISILNGSQIGSDATLMDGVRIGFDVQIGDRFIAQPGAVIGADGFSFVTPERSAIENVRETLGNTQDAAPQKFDRIHSLGSVKIGDDVEVGANSCIDRGTIRNTSIGHGCKFDNLVQIGHNVKIGNNCLICAQVGIAGSTTLGKNVVLGGQTGVSDNLFVGDNAITGGATKVLANVPAGRVMLGYPAMKMETQLNIYKTLRRLPRLMRDIKKLKSDSSESN